jgi:hypothetical protein
MVFSMRLNSSVAQAESDLPKEIPDLASPLNASCDA